MELIATHNSATGEKPQNLLSWLMIPFARTQFKTIQEQLNAGCTMFDIRVKKVKDTWYCAHGIFITKKTAWEILSELNQWHVPVYVCITYEGKLEGSAAIQKFVDWINTTKSIYTNIYWGPIAAKYTDNDIKVDWATILPSDKWYANHQGFFPLDGKHWQTYIPIPLLWDTIYCRKHNFNTTDYTFVDFL